MAAFTSSSCSWSESDSFLGARSSEKQKDAQIETTATLKGEIRQGATYGYDRNKDNRQCDFVESQSGFALGKDESC